jgi:hypothetical protein
MDVPLAVFLLPQNKPHERRRVVVVSYSLAFTSPFETVASLLAEVAQNVFHKTAVYKAVR